MKELKKLTAVILVLVMTAAFVSGCGKKDKAQDAGSGSGAPDTEVDAPEGDTAETGAAGDNTEGPAEESTAEPATIPGHYDLWTYAAGGEYSVEIPHDELGMTGFVFLEEDHSGKMGQSVSGTETANNDITWDEDGNIAVFGNNLYTFEVQGDVLIVDMGQGAVKYYYVREGVDGATAYNDFKEGKGIKDAAAITADNGEDNGGITSGANNDVTLGQMPVPADCMFHLAAREDMGKRITGNDLKKGGYDEYWLQSGVGGEVDFNMGTSDLHDGSYFLDDIYGAITKYTDVTEPLYPYSVAADGDVLFVKTKFDTLIFARDGVDTEAALKEAGDTPDLKIKSGDVPDDLTGFAPTPRDVKIPMKGGNIYFDPANGHIDYIEPDVTEIDYPRGFDGIGTYEIKFGLYDANKLKIFHCSPDMFPVYIEPDTGKYGQDIYATHAGFGCAALGHAMFCHHGIAATDSLGSIEYFEYGPVFCNANIKDYLNFRDSLSTDPKDYKLISGKDSDIKKLNEFVLDTDTDKERILERVSQFCRADYLYDYETGRFDTKYVDPEWVEKKESLRKSLKGHGIYNEGRAYLMRDMCVAAGVPCVTLVVGDTDVYCDNYKSYEDFYNRNHIGSYTKSRHADDYADEEIPDDVQEQIDALTEAANGAYVYNLAYAGGKWQLISGDGVIGLGKGAGPNGTFLRFEILEADGEEIDHVDRQECFKEIYEKQQDCYKKMIAKGELPDWSTFDHVLDDSGTYKLYDGIDEKGKVTLPEDTLGKDDSWIKLNMDGTGEMNFNGVKSKVAWCSNAGTLTCCSSDAKACASFSGWIQARETRDTTGLRWDGKSREHGIDARILYIKDGKYVEQFFHVLEPYGESMQLLDTDNIEQDGYRYRFLKDQGAGTPGSYGKSPWK